MLLILILSLFHNDKAISKTIIKAPTQIKEYNIRSSFDSITLSKSIYLYSQENCLDTINIYNNDFNIDSILELDTSLWLIFFSEKKSGNLSMIKQMLLGALNDKLHIYFAGVFNYDNYNDLNYLDYNHEYVWRKRFYIFYYNKLDSVILRTEMCKKYKNSVISNDTCIFFERQLKFDTVRLVLYDSTIILRGEYQYSDHLNNVFKSFHADTIEVNAIFHGKHFIVYRDNYWFYLFGQYLDGISPFIGVNKSHYEVFNN